MQGGHPLSGEGLGESDGLAAGLADVGLVEEPVHGRGGQGIGGSSQWLPFISLKEFALSQIRSCIHLTFSLTTFAGAPAITTFD